MTTGATGAPQRASDAPATMIIITQEEISRAPEYDIPGLLRHYSGMDVARYAIGQGEVSIRGGLTPYTPRLLVLVNGREVYLDSYGYTAWSALPVQLTEIQQIEVVKGPQSALYGFNAVAGVINIITRNPAMGDYATATASVGTNGFEDYQLSLGGALTDRFAVRASYGRTVGDEFDALPGALEAINQRVANTEYEREGWAVSGALALTDKVSVSAEYTHAQSELLELTSAYVASAGGYDLDSYRTELTADTDVGLLTFSAYRNDTTATYSFGDYEGELTVLRAQDLVKVGANNVIRLALEYRDATSSSFPDPSAGDLSYETISASVMWNRKLSNAVDFTVAGRYDSVDWSRAGEPNPALYPFMRADYDASIEEFSYNAALAWRLEAGGVFRFSAARGIQAPTMFDMGFVLNVVGLTVSGDPRIDPSIVDNFEVAYDRTLAGGVALRSAVFWQKSSDVKGTIGVAPSLIPPAAPAPTLLFSNAGDTTTWGFETSLSGDAGERWDWNLNYTLKQVEDNLAPSPSTTVRDFEGDTPEHVFAGRLGWEEGRWRADGFLNYVSARSEGYQPAFPSLRIRDIDAAVSVSARVSYDLTDQVALSMSGQNINYGDGEATSSTYETEARYWVSLTATF